MHEWPKVEKFFSPQEIVEVLFQRLKDAEGAREFVQDGPALYHHGFGTSVRSQLCIVQLDAASL